MSTNTVVVTGRAGCFSQRSAEPRNRAKPRRDSAINGTRPASRELAAPAAVTLTRQAGAPGRAVAVAAAHAEKTVAAVVRPSHRAAKAIVPADPPVGKFGTA